MTMIEEFNQASKTIGLDDDQDDEIAAKYIHDLHTNEPNVEIYLNHASVMIDRQLSRMYRKYNGTEFENSADAIEKTRGPIKLAWLAMIWQALAAGVLLGQKDPRFADLAKIQPEDFELAAIQYANEAAQDAQIMERVSHSFEQMLEETAEGTGFSSVMGTAIVVETNGTEDVPIPNEEAIKALAWKVWDLWSMIFSGGVHAYFACGYEIGKMRHEEEILNGIMTATEETP